MKILMTTDLYTPQVNGVVTSIRTLKHALEVLGHDVRVLTLGANSSINTIDKTYTVSSININRIYPGARLSLSANDFIYAEIIDWQPDIIHSHCEFSTFKMAKHLAEVLNIPIVHTYHTVYEDYTHYFSPNKKMGKKLVSFFSTHILKQTDLVIAPTQKVKDLLLNYSVDQTIEVVATGIDTKQFDQKIAADKKADLRNQYGIKDEDCLLLFVGRLAKEKNIEEILSFLHRMNQRQVKFLICGDGPNRQNLENLVANYGLQGRVHFAGMIDPSEVAQYYQLADIFVSASTSETQGLTYLEALLGGLPLLCRQDECLNNVIFKGVNGYTFSNYIEFESSLLHMINNPEDLEAMSQAGELLARKAYSAESFGKKMANIYKRLLTKSHPKLDEIPAKESSFLESIRSWVSL